MFDSIRFYLPGIDISDSWLKSLIKWRQELSLDGLGYHTYYKNDWLSIIINRHKSGPIVSSVIGCNPTKYIHGVNFPVIGIHETINVLKHLESEIGLPIFDYGIVSYLEIPIDLQLKHHFKNYSNKILGHPRLKKETKQGSLYFGSKSSEQLCFYNKSKQLKIKSNDKILRCEHRYGKRFLKSIMLKEVFEKEFLQRLVNQSELRFNQLRFHRIPVFNHLEMADADTRQWWHYLNALLVNESKLDIDKLIDGVGIVSTKAHRNIPYNLRKKVKELREHKFGSQESPFSQELKNAYHIELNKIMRSIDNFYSV